jgi:hypothetical protein
MNGGANYNREDTFCIGPSLKPILLVKARKESRTCRQEAICSTEGYLKGTM